MIKYYLESGEVIYVNKAEIEMISISYNMVKITLKSGRNFGIRGTIDEAIKRYND